MSIDKSSHFRRHIMLLPADLLCGCTPEEKVNDIKSMWGIRPEWNVVFRNGTLDPYTVSTDVITVDIFSHFTILMNQKLMYCQLYAPRVLTDTWLPDYQFKAIYSVHGLDESHLAWDEHNKQWLLIGRKRRDLDSLKVITGVWDPLFAQETYPERR